MPDLFARKILGLDPLYVANEGKLLAIVAAARDVDPVPNALRTHSLGKDAAVIGMVTDEHPGMVMMRTRVGGTRVVGMLSGEQLPQDLLILPGSKSCKAVRVAVANRLGRQELSQNCNLPFEPAFKLNGA